MDCKAIGLRRQDIEPIARKYWLPIEQVERILAVAASKEEFETVLVLLREARSVNG